MANVGQNDRRIAKASRTAPHPRLQIPRRIWMSGVVLMRRDDERS